MIPFKKKPLSVLLLLPCLSNYSSALGVGELSVRSPLGTPLQAEIPLTERHEGRLLVGLADAAAYRRLGVERKSFHQGLRFESVVDAGEPHIRVSSRTPITEPYVSFVLSVQWADGSLIRQYTTLIDPAPTIASSESSASSEVIQAQSGKTRFSSSVRTHSGDSLWRLARRQNRPADTNISQVMNALYQLNPHAFVNGDAAKLKPLVPIKTPTAEQIASAPRQFMPFGSQQLAGTEKPAAQARPASGGRADNRRMLSTAIPSNNSNNSKPSPGASDIKDQLEGIKAGIAAVESGKVRTSAHIAVLEQELDALVERYESMSQRAKTLEQQLGTTDTSQDTHENAKQDTRENTPALALSKYSSLIQFGGIMAAFAAAGLLLGHLIGRSRKPRRPGGKASRLPRFMQAKSTGSATYEQPYDRAPQPAPEHHPAPAVIRAEAEAEDAASEQAGEDTSLVAAGYTAFGMHAEAETLLCEAIIEHPERLDLQLQLLELYSNTSQPEQFEGLAETIAEKTEDPSVSTRIELLRLQFAANDAADETGQQQNTGA